MASRSGVKTISGKTEVPSAGTAVKLATAAEIGEFTCIEMQVQCDPSNTGTLCAVGDKSVKATKTLGKFQGLAMEKKQAPITLEVADPANVYVDAETSKDSVTWLLVVAN